MSGASAYHALYAGAVAAVPVGPVALMCFHRILTHGRLAGIGAGLARSAAIALYGALAALGAGLVPVLLRTGHPGITAAAGLVLAATGVFLVRGARTVRPRRIRFKGGFAASSFLLTLVNPAPLLLLTGITAGLRLQVTGPVSLTVWTLGVFCGAAAWWAVAGLLPLKGRFRVTPRIAKNIARAIGALIIMQGCVICVRGILAWIR